MKKDTKTILGFALLLFALSGAATATVRRYILPNGQSVLEEQLPSFGFVLYQGNWYDKKQLDAVMGQTRSTTDWQSIINSGQELFKNGRSAWDLIKDIFGNKSTLPVDNSNQNDLDDLDNEGD